MVFDVDDDQRQVLMAELRCLPVRAAVLEWVDGVVTELEELTHPVAIPFWNEVLRSVPIDATRQAPVVPDTVFRLAAQAYLRSWCAEVEDDDLFAAARRLGQAAQRHLSIRGNFVD